MTCWTGLFNWHNRKTYAVDPIQIEKKRKVILKHTLKLGCEATFTILVPLCSQLFYHLWDAQSL